MEKFSVQKLALEHVNELRSYVPGKQPDTDGWIKLNTNENPFPPAPGVSRAIHDEVEQLPLYPSPASAPLRNVIAALHGVSEKQVFAGNGSDEILKLLIQAFSDQKRAVGMTDPSYSLYPVLAAINQARLVRIPFSASMKLPVEAIIASAANLFLLTSPNAPTGVAFSNRLLAEIARKFPGLLVVDEAYVDFAEENAVALLSDHPNIVVVRTLSKSYALAGLRVGYAVAHVDVIDRLDRIRDSYNVNRLSQAAACAAIRDQGYFHEQVNRIKALRSDLTAHLESMGWFTYPSQSNFIFTRPQNSKGEFGASFAAGLFEYLQANRILVRYFPANPLTEGFLRISVGSSNQNKKLMETIEAWRKTV